MVSALSLCSLALTCITPVAHAQHGRAGGEWRTYGGNLGSTRYVPRDEMNAGNFGQLQVAWRFKTDVFGVRPGLQPSDHAADDQRRVCTPRWFAGGTPLQSTRRRANCCRCPG